MNVHFHVPASYTGTVEAPDDATPEQISDLIEAALPTLPAGVDVDFNYIELQL